MTKHTPTPWKYEFSPSEQGTPAQAWIMGGDGLSVVSRQNCGGDQDAKANAEHIVKCVNMHEELVGALKLTHEQITKGGLTVNPLARGLINVIEDALQKAGAL